MNGNIFLFPRSAFSFCNILKRVKVDTVSLDFIGLKPRFKPPSPLQPKLTGSGPFTFVIPI